MLESFMTLFISTTLHLLSHLWLLKWTTLSSMVVVLIHSEYMVHYITKWELCFLQKVTNHSMHSFTSMTSRLLWQPITPRIPILIMFSWVNFRPCSMHAINLSLCTSRLLRSCRGLLPINKKISKWVVLQQGVDHHRYNLPTVDEVAAIIPGMGEEDVDQHRDIILHYNDGGYKHLSHLHPLYVPLHYVMLFPNWDQGWHRHIKVIQPEEGSVQSQYVSQRCYFAFHLHLHPMEPSDLFRGGRFLQQYIVNAWVSIEDSMLFWVHCHMCLCSKD